MKAVIDKSKTIEEEIGKHEPKKVISVLRNGVVLSFLSFYCCYYYYYPCESFCALVFDLIFHLFLFFGIFCFPKKSKHFIYLEV